MNEDVERICAECDHGEWSHGDDGKEACRAIDWPDVECIECECQGFIPTPVVPQEGDTQ